MNFFKRLFHKHEWEVKSQDYLGDSRYLVISRCKFCGKITSEVFNIDD